MSERRLTRTRTQVPDANNNHVLKNQQAASMICNNCGKDNGLSTSAICWYCYEPFSEANRSSVILDNDKKRLKWIDRRLGQIGIDVRQSKHHIQMRYYLEL